MSGGVLLLALGVALGAMAVDMQLFDAFNRTLAALGAHACVRLLVSSARVDRHRQAVCRNRFACCAT